MKLLLPLILAPALFVAAPPQDPVCTITLGIPRSALELKLEYKQLGDLAPFTETASMSVKDLHGLRVKSLLVQGGKFKSDLTFKVGEDTFPPGEYPLGFTIGTGGAVHPFLAQGEKSVEVMSEAFTPGWNAPCVDMHLVYVSRNEARLVWQLKDKAGTIKLLLGPSPDAAAEPGDGKPAAAPAEKPAAPAPKAAPKAAAPAPAPPKKSAALPAAAPGESPHGG